jgi:hypothetical protein
MSLKESQDLNAAEEAVSNICTKADNPQSYTEKLTGLLAKAQPAQKSALLRVLGIIGGTNALRAVRASVDDSNAEVHTAAIRALCGWKTTDAASELLALAKTSGNPNDKTLCLRGYIGLAARPELSAGQRLSMCREAAALIERNDEKKLLLGALGGINSTDALELITPYLDEPATREEAGTAIVAIAEKLLKDADTSAASKLIGPLQKTIEVTANTDLARRAKALLRQAQKQGKG